MRTSFSFIKGEVGRIPRSARASVSALDFIKRPVAFLGVCPPNPGGLPRFARGLPRGLPKGLRWGLFLGTGVLWLSACLKGYLITRRKQRHAN